MAATATSRPGRFATIVARIRAEYQEMPGLALTREQAQRLWHLDAATCGEALEHLVASNVLKQTRRGRFVRVEQPTHGRPRAAQAAGSPRSSDRSPS